MLINNNDIRPLNDDEIEVANNLAMKRKLAYDNITYACINWRVAYGCQGNFTVCLVILSNTACAIGVSKRNVTVGDRQNTKRGHLLAFRRAVGR